MMRLACGDNAFPLLPHDVAVGLIAGLGFEGFDLMVMSNSWHVQPDQIFADIPGWAARLDERVRGRGLEFADVMCLPSPDFASLAANNPDRAARERSTEVFKGMLEFTARLGAPGLTMLPGIDWPDEDHEDSLSRAADVLAARTAEARRVGVRFSVEPHIGSVCATPADVRKLCELAPELELTLDYTHFIAQGFDESEIETLLGRARHVHTRGVRLGMLQAPLSGSTVDYERTIDALGDIKYEGYLAVEYIWVEWNRLNEVDVVSETVLLRDRLRAKLAGQPWSYPVLSGVKEAPSPSID